MYLYLEVPLYAKNMLYGAGCDAVCKAEYNDHYISHHPGKNINMDYGQATGSEAAEFEVITGVNFNGSYLAKLQGEKNSSKGKKSKGKKSKGKKSKGKKSKGKQSKGKTDPSNAGPGVTGYATSLEWLLGNGTCDMTDCYDATTKMSFEFALDINVIDVDDIIKSIKTPDTAAGEGLVFHLSPERRASVVPVPAAAWLFGSALGLLGWMRRKSS